MVKPVEGENKNLPNSSTDAFISAISAPEQPMREDQVQNAVKFLSHPKVRGSPVVYRRSFLEKKGLTREEIDEAFRRVPDPPPAPAGTEAAKPPQATAASPEVPSPTIQTVQTAITPSNAVPQPAALQSRFQWPYIVLAVGVLATSGAGTAVIFKKAVIPRLKAWIRRVVKEEDDSEKKERSTPSAAEEAAEAAKAAASAAAVVAKACENMLTTRNEEKKYFETFAGLLEAQVKEMKSMGSAIRGLESARESVYQQEKRKENGTVNNTLSPPRTSSVSPQGWKVNGATDISARPSSAPASAESNEIPYPKSFVEIMSMVQRGEKPPGIKEVNDMPPNPNQQPSNPRLAPRVKPWEASAPAQPSSGYGQASEQDDNRPIYPVNSEPSDWSEQPSWKQKPLDLEEPRTSSYGIGSKNWPGRDWVPPQTPSVAIPEAAAAIRKPKPKQPPPSSATELPSGQSPALIEDSENPEDGTSGANFLGEIKAEEVNGA